MIDFNEFWSTYPRKTGDKKKCEVLFNKLTDADKFNAIHGAQHQTRNNPQWKDPKFIPMPATFINQKRWKDEIVVSKPAVTRVAAAAATSLAHLVWSEMAQMFGKAWVDKHGEQPNDIWRKMVNGIGEERVLRGLRKTLDSKSDFPPSLPKFMEYCAKNFKELHPDERSPPRSNRDLALDAFKKVNELLGVKK